MTCSSTAPQASQPRRATRSRAATPEPGLNGVLDGEQALDPGERSNSLPVPGDSPRGARPRVRLPVVLSPLTRATLTLIKAASPWGGSEPCLHR